MFRPGYRAIDVSASVLPFCGLPPVTMIGDCGKNCGGSPSALHASSTTRGTMALILLRVLSHLHALPLRNSPRVQRPCCQLQCGGQLKVALHTRRRRPLPRPNGIMQRPLAYPAMEHSARSLSSCSAYLLRRHVGAHHRRGELKSATDAGALRFASLRYALPSFSVRLLLRHTRVLIGMDLWSSWYGPAAHPCKPSTACGTVIASTRGRPARWWPLGWW